VAKKYEMTTKEAVRGLADAVNHVAFGGDRIVLTRRGKRIAALVSIQDLEQFEQFELERGRR
jgi:prevent-host-death family protein